MTNTHNSATVSSKHNLNRKSSNSELQMAVFSLKTLLYANDLPFPSLSNWDRSREELTLYWRFCSPDVSHDLKVCKYPPYPAADI